MISFAVHNDQGRCLQIGDAPNLALVYKQVPAGGGYVIGNVPTGLDHYLQGDAWVSIGARPAPGWEFDWAAKMWVDLRDMDGQRAAQWELVKAGRDAAETAGFIYMGKLLQSDERSVARITGATQAAQKAIELGLPFAIDWTCDDNTVLSLDAEGMTGMPAALAAYVNTLFEQGRVLRQAIADANTPAAIAAIVWSLP